MDVKDTDQQQQERCSPSVAMWGDAAELHAMKEELAVRMARVASLEKAVVAARSKVAIMGVQPSPPVSLGTIVQ